MKLDRQSFFDTQHFKQKGQVMGVYLREVLAQSLIA
jgi:hypothetical protein